MDTQTKTRSDMSRASDGNSAYSFAINNREANSLKKFPSNFIRTTKYTLITFVPKNLFEQFRRVSNFYFFVVVVIQLIPSVSPLSPITSILPLVFVLVVTAIKEALEDFNRYRADKKNNIEPFKVIREGKLEVIPSQDIEVGEIVYIANGQHFPADFVLLSSSSDDGICYVETANLDGETNLKVRKSLDVTAVFQDASDLSELKASIQCEPPNERLYRFNGRLVIDGKEKQVFSLNHTMFLQRGAQLRNTKYCYGVCVYAGVDTKLFLNQQPPPSKFSTVERVLNKFILFVFVCQILICLACAIGSALFAATSDSTSYTGPLKNTIPVYAVSNFFTYFVLFNTMIPISLWVTLELVRVGQAKFMEWDELMGADGANEDSSCKAKTSNLNEDLGRIQHIFSDKTGTLTENLMNFCKCSVRMNVFDEKINPGSLMSTIEYPTTSDETAEEISDFLRILALCHTVVSEVNDETGEITYQSQSPDETALVETARNNGFVFVKRKADEIIIKERGVDVSYALLAVLEFSSVRRRMSVVVRTPEGKIKLLSKGADLVMFDRMMDGDRNAKDETLRNLKEFSREGYRTLVLAQREVSVEEFSEWKMAFYQANNALDNREEKVENICELIETELYLVGCSAIEDKLQDEVPETIHYLLEAGIQLWVLTGDKQETAINIGYSSRLLNPAMELILINADNSEICGEMMRAQLTKLEETPPDQEVEMGMVIDGHSLGFALHDHTEEFLRLGRACRSVICCRVTPLQKALVVRVVKQGEQKVSLAIGDGANDVSMIQEAHVGVGIFGKEGTQAARASDYSIHQFKHLKRLLCVHGRYSYVRVAGIIQYSFYKNMSFTLGLLWFSFYNSFTGQTLYDSWIITLYNIAFTSLPPLVYGLFEKDLNEDVIGQHAEVYHRMQNGQLFTKFTFFVWLLSGLWHSFVVFFGAQLIFESDILFGHGKATGMWEMGLMSATYAIFIVNLRMALEIKTHNLVMGGVILLSLVAYLLFWAVYNSLIGISVDLYYVFFHLLGSPSFYLTIILYCVAALLPDFVAQYYSRQYNPQDWQILREKYRRSDLVELKIENIKRQTSMTSRSNGPHYQTLHTP